MITSPYSVAFGTDRERFDEFVDRLQQYTLCKIPKEIVQSEYEAFSTAQQEIERQKPVEQIKTEMEEEVKAMPQDEQAKARSAFHNRIPISSMENLLASEVNENAPQQYRGVGQNANQPIVEEQRTV